MSEDEYKETRSASPLRRRSFVTGGAVGAAGALLGGAGVLGAGRVSGSQARLAGKVSAAGVPAGSPHSQITMTAASGSDSESGLFNVVTGYGADNTGATDVTTAFQDAWNACQAAGGGTIYVPGGTYKRARSTPIGGDCQDTAIYWRGPGTGAATIMDYGSGDLFRQYDSTDINTRAAAGGGILGITINGANAAGSGGGIHFGDISRLQWDVAVWNYAFDASSYGFRIDNQYYWAEQMQGNVTALQCAQHFIFESSTDLSGSATGSFDRANLGLFLVQAGKGNGLILRNHAECQGGNIYYGGNFNSNASTVYSAISVDGTSSYFGTMNLDIEFDDSKTKAPMTMDMASGATWGGHGLMNFGQSPGNWTETNGTSGMFPSGYFNAFVSGDNNLYKYAVASIQNYLSGSL